MEAKLVVESKTKNEVILENTTKINGVNKIKDDFDLEAQRKKLLQNVFVLNSSTVY
jgi:hypothetical protein